MYNFGFIDIETVPNPQHMPMDGPDKKFFEKRFNWEYNADPAAQWEQLWEKNAGMLAEYCQIVSISIGTLRPIKDSVRGAFFVKTFTGRDEVAILKDFAEALKKADIKTLVGHNIKEFDGPVLMRRYLINGLPIPPILDCMLKKTWDIPFYDTMEMWSGSQWKYKISQDHLAHLLGVESSKGAIDGSKISGLFYSNGLTADMDEAEAEMKEGLRLIGEYNASDVVCNARIYAKLRGLPDIRPVDVHFIPNEKKDEKTETPTDVV